MKHQVSPTDEPNQFAFPSVPPVFSLPSKILNANKKGGRNKEKKPTVFHPKIGSNDHKSITLYTSTTIKSRTLGILLQ